MKKLVSFILIAVMLVSALSVSAFAQAINFVDNEIMLSVRDSSYIVSLDNLSKYGVIKIEQHTNSYYTLILDRNSHQNVLDVIEAMQAAENAHLYTVKPNYVQQVEDLFKDQLYYKRFVEEYGDITIYHEEYYHHVDEDDDTSDIDWVLISAATAIMVEPIDPPEHHYLIIGDIVYGSTYYYEPFYTQYCVYDVAKDEFLDITAVDFDEYKGLREAFCNGKYGILVGDVDVDGEVSVLDATEIQRAQAKLSTLKVVFLVKDYNRDKSFDVLDATAIQKHLAGFDNEP